MFGSSARHLAKPDRDRLSAYMLPPLPPRFMERHGAEQMLVARSQQRRKERSDILVPLYHVLVALIQLRKQAAERMILAFREACKRAEAGEALPLRFSYEEHLPTVNRNATTIAEVHIAGRGVCMEFLLWNRRTWTLAHRERFSKTTVRDAEAREGSYRPAIDGFFLQFTGEPSNLLWFGDLVAQRLLQQLNLSGPSDQCYQDRLTHARVVGASQGFSCSRPGLLTPSRETGYWLTRNGDVFPEGELYFDPEPLYLGCLYGAALATIALTNGSRVNELLQVSLDRRKTRTEIVTVTKDGKTEQRKTTLHLQHLLPKGARTDEERQYFLLSPQSVTLLGEILQQLMKQHGNVPVVHPPARGSKSEYLQPERYLFQWAASSDGQTGVLDIKDTVILLRFVLHGLDLCTAQGEPIKVTTHLLRHVTATVLRDEAVPVEAIQWTLHHQPERHQIDGVTLSAATEYYTRMPEEKRMHYLHRFHLAVEGRETALEIAVPDEHTLQEMEEKLRAVFERWGAINPTNFGYCGRTGLCPRGTSRALCIGCPYLIPDPDKLDEALHWEKLYRELGDQLRAAGSLRDGQQAEAQARDLRDIIAVMRLYRQAEAERQFVPSTDPYPDRRRRINIPMFKPSHASGYTEQRLAGLRRHAAQQRQVTLERLQTAIASLKAKEEPITVHTVRETSGLDYKSYARNPAALALFQENSTFLVARRKEARGKRQKGAAHPRDPLLNYKRPQLAARLRQEMKRREEIEVQYRQLLEERVQTDLKMMQLEAELAKYQSFLGQLRAQVEREEYDGKSSFNGEV